jgi:hypothetical protein
MRDRISINQRAPLKVKIPVPENLFLHLVFKFQLDNIPVLPFFFKPVETILTGFTGSFRFDFNLFRPSLSPGR